MWVLPPIESEISDISVGTNGDGKAEQAIPSKRDADSRVSVSMWLSKGFNQDRRSA